MLSPRFRPARSPHDGFTVLELMVTLSILVILTTLAAPGVTTILMNVRMSGLVNDMMADLALARSEAIKRGLPVMLCPSTTGTACAGSAWGSGWMVFADVDRSGGWTSFAVEPPLKSRETVPSGIIVTVTNAVAGAGGLSYIPYGATGTTNTSSAANRVIRICDGRPTTEFRGREITISPTGRPVVTKVGC